MAPPHVFTHRNSRPKHVLPCLGCCSGSTLHDDGPSAGEAGECACRQRAGHSRGELGPTPVHCTLFSRTLFRYPR